MDMKNIVGLKPLKEAVEKVIEQRTLFQNCNLEPNHMVFTGLGSGNGVTMVANQITDLFYKYHIREFSALDLSLEYKPDGKSQDKLEKVLADIETAAVYCNHYEGIIFMNLDDLVPYVQDSHIESFIHELSEIGKHATLIFFVDNSKRNIEILLRMLKKEIKNLDVVHVTPYSKDELVQITRTMIESHNITVDVRVDDIIAELIAERDIKTAKECIYLKNELVKYTDTEQYPPILSWEQLHMNYKGEGVRK